jgi:hypothetical protein
MTRDKLSQAIENAKNDDERFKAIQQSEQYETQLS